MLRFKCLESVTKFMANQFLWYSHTNTNVDIVQWCYELYLCHNNANMLMFSRYNVYHVQHVSILARSHLLISITPNMLLIHLSIMLQLEETSFSYFWTSLVCVWGKEQDDKKYKGHEAWGLCIYGSEHKSEGKARDIIYIYIYFIYNLASYFTERPFQKMWKKL